MNLGVIGYGLRARSILGEIGRQDPACRVAAVVDPREKQRGNGRIPATVHAFTTRRKRCWQPSPA
ncbi:hypothetical protein N6H14_12685 [Paenibacillus sp. CC-CFT747]|nr:hypothetical protein N6H14_12685 [Paenibacillus sp. CC-CFT747]